MELWLHPRTAMQSQRQRAIPRRQLKKHVPPFFLSLLFLVKMVRYGRVEERRFWPSSFMGEGGEAIIPMDCPGRKKGGYLFFPCQAQGQQKCRCPHKGEREKTLGIHYLGSSTYTYYYYYAEKFVPFGKSPSAQMIERKFSNTD